ncbi:predicted protein [Chaetoceros tenuissimus]|uniref:Uncharacterized protein n=1 Tax=Chaetoceros tenuissimus TaxID=426638 RepID=A0AAD3HFS2_9STRA|nr:predicted protein [Chaetoceros tenuissimus]
MIDTIHNDLSALTDSGDEAEHIPTRPFTAPVKSQRKDYTNNLPMRPITSQGRRASTSFIPVERPRTAVPSDRLKFIEKKQSSENSIFSSSMSNAAHSSYRPSSAGRSDTFIEYRRQQHEKMMERKNSQSSNLSSNDGSFRDAAKDERRDGVDTSSANSSTGSSRKEQMQNDREIRRSILRQEMKAKREEMLKRTEYCRNSLKDLRDHLDEVDLNRHSIKRPIGILKNKIQDTTMTPAENKGEEVTLVEIKKLKGRLSELQNQEQQDKAFISEEKERVQHEEEQETERTNVAEEEKVISKPIKQQKRVQLNISSDVVEESEDYGSTYNSEEYDDTRSYYSDDTSHDESTMYGDTFDDANIGKSQCSWKVW